MPEMPVITPDIITSSMAIFDSLIPAIDNLMGQLDTFHSYLLQAGITGNILQTTTDIRLLLSDARKILQEQRGLWESMRTQLNQINIARTTLEKIKAKQAQFDAKKSQLRAKQSALNAQIELAKRQVPLSRTIENTLNALLRGLAAVAQ